MRSNPQFPANLVTFTEKILNGKLHFLCTDKFKAQDRKHEIRMNFFVTVSRMSYCQISFRITEPNMVKQIKNSCRWIKFHTLFTSLRRGQYFSVDWYLYLSLLNLYYKWNNLLSFQQTGILLSSCLLVFFSNFCIVSPRFCHDLSSYKKKRW